MTELNYKGCFQIMYEALKQWHDHQQGTRGHYCSKCANAMEQALAKAESKLKEV